MSLRGLPVCVLLVAALSLGLCGAESWRAKVSPSVLRWIDSGATTPRELLLRLTIGTAGLPTSPSYVGASHVAWWTAGRTAAGDVELWAELVGSFAIRRSAASPWEAGLSYIHALGSVLVRASSAGARQLAQLPGVAAILDAANSVPAPSVFAVGEVIAASSAAPAPGALLARGDVSGDELGAWMSSLGWRYVSLAGIGLSDDLEAPLTWSATELALAADHSIVGLAVADETRQWLEGEGLSLAGALAESAWGVRVGHALSVAELACLVEAMGQAGANGVGIAPIAIRGNAADLYVLLRSDEGAGWASLGAPGQGVPTTADTLPRGEPPSDVSATLGSYDDRVVVRWQPAPGGSSYEILRARPGAAVYEPIGMAVGTSFEDRNVERCIQYAYVARSIDPAGVGMESIQAVGFVGHVPMPPSEAWTDGGAEAGAIRVEWMPSAGATSYRVMRNHYTTGSTTVTSQQYAVGVTTEPVFVDRDVVVGQTYLYRIFALNGCGQSRLSPQAKGSAYGPASASAGALLPPSWFETTRGEPRDEVLLYWTAAQGADGYIVYRALNYAGPYAEVARVTQTSWSDLDVVLCGDRWYRVASTRGPATSEPTPILYGSYGYRPVMPERIRASHGTYSNSIRIDWAAVDDAQSYNVLRAPAREGPYAVIASSIVDLYFVDEGLSPGQTFWYQAQAANPCGCSGSTEAVSGSTTSH